jgi:iron(III) transport system substrate-binding protein
MALVAACSPAREADVTLYTSVDQNHAEPVLRAIETRSGLRIAAVHDIEAAKTTGLVNRLLAERERPVADVFWSSECLQTLRLEAAGVLAPFPAAVGDRSVRPYERWAAVGGRLRVILVNMDHVSETNSPRSVDDLLDERWPASRVGLARPLFGTTATHAAALYAARGPADGRAFFARVQARGVRILDGNATVRDLVASGELWWGLTDSDDALGALRRGAPVRVVLPDQAEGEAGTLAIPMSVALIAGGPHPDAARRLAAELLSAATLAQLAAQGFVTPADAPPPRLMDTPWPAMLGHLERSRAELRELFLR